MHSERPENSCDIIHPGSLACSGGICYKSVRLTTLKTVWYPKLIFIHFDSGRIVENGMYSSYIKDFSAKFYRCVRSVWAKPRI